MKVNGGSCPSLETIGAFVDGRFKERERDVIAEHLASCEACYFVFAESARLRAPAVVVFWTWRRIAGTAATGLAAAASIVLAVNLSMGVFRSEDARLEELVAAVGANRAFDPRLTGGFAHAPVRVQRSGGAIRPSLSPDARIVIARIEKDLAASPPSRLQALVSLLVGETNAAVQVLEQSTRDTNDARLLSDLAAAYLIRFDQFGNPEDNSRALTAANRALAIDRQLPEALFNRALALGRLQMNADARKAWEAYLAVDNQSGWADEARSRLRLLSTQP